MDTEQGWNKRPGAVACPCPVPQEGSPCPDPAAPVLARRDAFCQQGQKSSGCSEPFVLSCPPVLVLPPPGACAPAVPQAACCPVQAAAL